jgi:hypothetical protein
MATHKSLAEGVARNSKPEFRLQARSAELVPPNQLLFLIANALLEFSVTHRKHSFGGKSNRKQNRVSERAFSMVNSALWALARCSGKPMLQVK